MWLAIKIARLPTSENTAYQRQECGTHRSLSTDKQTACHTLTGTTKYTAHLWLIATK